MTNLRFNASLAVHAACPPRFEKVEAVVELIAVLTKDALQEIVDANAEIMRVIREQGSSGHKNMRGRAKGIRAVVSEI